MGTNAWLLLTGFVFFWAVLGTDPFPTPISLRYRRTMLVIATTAHALFAGILLSTDKVIGERFYLLLELPWNPNLLDVQRLGGAVAFGFGVGTLLLVTLILLVPQGTQIRQLNAEHPSAVTTASSGLPSLWNMLVAMTRTRTVPNTTVSLSRGGRHASDGTARDPRRRTGQDRRSPRHQIAPSHIRRTENRP